MSSLLFDVIFASRCRGTHHRLAMDALRFVRGEASGRWCRLFLSRHEPYLEGSKAPDDLFKDFRNHVLHVREKFWGGAISAAEKWFHRTVDAFRRQSWEEGVYAAGVLSHYFTDPFQPLHTAQSETENVIHRAVEWSIAQSYGELQQILEHDQGGYPEFEAPEGDDWLGEMIRDGAERANQDYQTVIEHYNLQKGVHEPAAGLDQELKDAIARQIGRAAVGFGRVLEVVFEESDVLPPEVDITIQGFLATLQVPLYKLSGMLEHIRERWRIVAMYDEYQRTGKVLQSLSEDERSVRRLHAQEVLALPLEQLDAEPAGEIGVLHGEGAAGRPRSNRPMTGRPKMRPAETAERPAAKKAEGPVARRPVPERETARVGQPPQQDRPAPIARPVAPPVASKPPQANPRDLAPLPLPDKTRPSVVEPGPTAEFYLELESPVAAAPSIGPKTAERLGLLEISTVADLLEIAPETAAAKLQSRFITADVLRDWQAQATLACCVPKLRGHDAQILVACGIREPSHLAGLDRQALFTRVDAFCNSPAGQRVLRNGNRPTVEEVMGWIEHAGMARTLRAA